MFSFHKPRVYRSTEGCCICRAKSSSSRFTDSKKYEDDSVKCFNLEKPRKGEICNACVLLVKRFKRLPAGSNRHWGHVVDARIGPGMKSMTKFKKLREESLQQTSTDNVKFQSSKSSTIPEKFCKIFKKNKKKKLIQKNVVKEKRERSPGSWDEQSLPPTPESLNSDGEDAKYSSQHHHNRAKFSKNVINRRKIRKPQRYRGAFDNITFFDEKEWKQLNSCCGIVYENFRIGALIVDIQKYKPCTNHSQIPQKVELKPLSKLESSLHKSIQEEKHLIPENNVSISREEYLIPTTALKKHHLFFKRQLATFPKTDISTINIKTDIDSTTNQQKEASIEMQPMEINTTKSTILHKLKSDANKIKNHAPEKVGTVCLKQVDVNEIKSFIKVSDKTLKLKTAEDPSNALCRKPPVDQSGNKFSDNSSDSGFDENLQELKLVNSMQKEDDEGEKKIVLPRPPTQTMFLAGGVQIQSQQPNIILTASEIATKMLQTRRQQSQITAQYAQNSGSQKLRAIFNGSSEGIVKLSGTSTPTTVLNVTPSAGTLNQKIIFVKAKYNNQSPN